MRFLLKSIQIFINDTGAIVTVVCSSILMCSISCSKEMQYKDASTALSIEKELATFEIESGLRVELVATEPMIQH